MRAIELTAPSLDALRSAVLPDPEPGSGEALVRRQIGKIIVTMPI